MDVPVVGAAAAPGEAPAVPQSGVAAGPQPQQQSAPQAENRGTLSPVVAKLFGQGSTTKLGIEVSYRVVHDPNMIVTVFTDPETGEEVAQVPPEIMVQIAQFFDQHSGVTLDGSA